MATLFISDLHLCAERPKVTQLFLEFLRERARRAEALYILGDLFEYWIGDEAAAMPEFVPIIRGIRGASDAGVPVFVMVGNRDFLMGAEFERLTGSRLLPDPSVVELYGTRVLLMHGDSLCTDDLEHQAFRRLSRSPEWIAEVLAKSPQERIALSRKYREMSMASTATKRPEIMDVNAQAVAGEMARHGVQHLLHGHTHRPAIHSFELDERPARRLVLGDWYEQGSVLVWDRHGYRLENLPLPAAATGRAGAAGQP